MRPSVSAASPSFPPASTLDSLQMRRFDPKASSPAFPPMSGSPFSGAIGDDYRMHASNSLLPGTPLVNYSPAMFPHDYKGMSAGSLQVTSAASPSLSSLTPAFNSYNPYNFRSNLNHLTPSISSVNNITSVGAGSPLSFSVSHPTSSPSTLSLLGTVGGMLGSNQTNEGANWRNRNFVNLDKKAPPPIPNVDDAPLSLNGEPNVVHIPSRAPAHAHNKSVSGSPSSVGIVGLQAFTKGNQKRNVKFENPHQSPMASAASPSLQALLDAPPDFGSPAFASSKDFRHHSYGAISPLHSPENSREYDDVVSIRVKNDGDVVSVIQRPETDDDEDDEDEDVEENTYEAQQSEAEANKEFLAAASSLCGYAATPALNPLPRTKTKPIATSKTSANVIVPALPATGNGSGTSCHQCKSRRGMNNLIYCSNIFNKKSDERRQSCRKKYCENCLKRFYGEKAPDQKSNPSVHWPCPACRGLCSCAACRRNKSDEPAPVYKVQEVAITAPAYKKSKEVRESDREVRRDPGKKRSLVKRPSSPSTGLDLIADIASSPEIVPNSPNVDSKSKLETEEFALTENTSAPVSKSPVIPAFQNLFEQQKAQYLQQLFFVQQQVQMHQLISLQQATQAQNKETMNPEQFAQLQQQHTLQVAAAQAQLQQQMQQFLQNSSSSSSSS